MEATNGHAPQSGGLARVSSWQYGPAAMRRRAAAAMVLALGAVGVGAPVAGAQDSMAPKGALPHWLPTERWVYEHWLPFDEGRLYRLLGADRGDIWNHLRDDAAHDLEQLGRRRGYTPRRLARALVAPRAGTVSRTRLRQLEGRAYRVLVQGHLSQHILFHSLHQRTIPLAAPQLFGTATVEEYLQLRRAELSPLQIGRQHGRTRAQMQRETVAALRATNAEGVRTGAVSARQAKLLLDRQLRQVPRWLGQARYNGPPQTGTKGAQSIPLLPPGDYANNPSISDDGETVVFDAYRAKIPEAKREGEISVVSTAIGGPLLPISHPRRSSGPLAPRSAYNSAISGDGRTVVYEQAEGNLNFAKRYSEMQVLARPRPAVRAATPVSHPRSRLARPPRSAYNPSVSADGRLVSFEATDDGGGTRPSRNGVWVRDLTTGTDRLIGQGSGGAVYEPRLVGDGSALLVTVADAGSDGHTLVYLRGLAPDAPTTLVSRATGAGGAAAGADANQPAASHDGGAVVFASAAPELGARRGRARIFVRDVAAATTTAVSPRDAFAFDPAISADGRFIAYAARRGSSPTRSSIWLYDRAAGSTTLVSRRPDGTPADGYNAEPAVAAGGTRVAFTSTGGRLARAKPADLAGVFLFDVARGTTALLSAHAPLKAKASATGTGGRSGAFLCPLAP